MNQIHPTAIIGDDVVLGGGNVIGPNVILLGRVEIGDDNWFGPGVTVGTPPEVRGVEHGAQWLSGSGGPGVRIGSRTVLREGTLVHQGWKAPTTVGNDCFIMNKVYVAHDVWIGDGATLASTVTMGGHVQIGERANLGMACVVHQHRVVGPGAMVGMGAVVTRDVPPFAKAYGTPARQYGLNAVGMSRMGIADADVAALAALYAAPRDDGAIPFPPALERWFRWWVGRTSGQP